MKTKTTPEEICRWQLDLSRHAVHNDLYGYSGGGEDLERLLHDARLCHKLLEKIREEPQQG